VIRPATGPAVTIDYRERAPLKSTPTMYLDSTGKISRQLTATGYLAPGVPGTVRGLALAHKRYGKLPWADVVMPAVTLAEKGFPLADGLARSLNREVAGQMARYPASVAAYGKPGGGEWQKGDTIVLKDLARTLRAIATKGPNAFYTGWIADSIAASMAANGGLISKADLAAYQAKVRTPVRGTFRGYELISMPPPSSGGVAMIEMLNMLERFDLAKAGPRSPHTLHLIIEAQRRAYLDRARYLGDPDFVKMPLDELGSPLYAAGLRASIHPEKATPSDMLPGYLPKSERDHTSHFSIIDADGNLVSVTQTVNLSLGDALVVPGTGFVMNDEMDDFALKAGAPNAFGLVGNDANAPKPGHRPLSSMTPSFIIGADRIGVIGTPGGSTIITQVLEGVLAFIDGELPAQIVANPRFHHQYLPDVITAEHGMFSADEVKGLEAMGHKVSERSHPWGFMNVVSWDRKSGKLHAGSDSRRASGSGIVK